MLGAVGVYCCAEFSSMVTTMLADLDRIQGSWYVAAVETDGEAMTDAGDARVIVERHSFKSLGMGADYEGTIEIDSTRKPKHFDIVFSAGHATGMRHVGIYELAGDRWTICLNTQGTKRPKSFRTRQGSGVVIETLERRRSARSVNVKGKRPVDTTRGPASPIDGEWIMVAGVMNGAAISEEMVKWCRRVTGGGVTTVLAGPRVMLKARFSIDSSATPHTIDYVNLEGSAKGKAQKGILDLRVDALQVCMAAPGKPRPSTFGSVRGDGRSFTTWRRRSATVSST